MAETYYKLAVWRASLGTWQDNVIKKTFPTPEAARAYVANKPGRYRVSAVAPDGRTDGEPFEAYADPCAKAARASMRRFDRNVYPNHATRPMGGRPH